MIKTAYILTPIDFGGSENVSLTFLKNVDRDRFDIHLFILYRPWEKENTFLNKIKSYNYPICKIPVALKPKSQGKEYLRVIRCFFSLFHHLSKKNFNIIHTHGYFADVIGIPIAKILNIPHISTCHGFVSIDNRLKIYNKIDLLFLRFSQKIITVSESIKSLLIMHRISNKKIEVLQNAVEIKENKPKKKSFEILIRNQYKINKNSIILGYVGRLSEEKGLIHLIQAVSELIKSNLNIVLLIIGDGPQKKDIEYLIESRKLKRYVFLTGFKEDVNDFLEIIDIFILPSLTEGTPMALLESMAKGLPVVATSVGGIPQIITSGDNGILISPSKVDAIIEAVDKLYNDFELRLKIGKNAKETIKNTFNVNTWIERLQTIYTELNDHYANSD